MYSNEQFKQAITHASPRVAFRMTSLSDSEVITSVGNGLLLEANWDFVSESFIGEFPVWKLKASFMYLDDKKSYVDQEFLCEVGAYSVNNNGDYADLEWIPIGRFVVPEDGQVTDEIMHQINLTMYDHGSVLDKQYVPLDFPLTGLQIRNQIAARNGLTYSPNQSTLIYDSFVFDGINVSSGQAITDREILRQYAQINMASVYVDRSGQLLMKSVFTGTPIDAEINNYDYSELKHEVEYGPVNSLIYSNKASGDEHAYQEIEAKDEGSIALNGKKSLEFSNNIFLDPLTLEEQQTEVDKLFAIVNGFSYAPFDLEYFARPDFDPYDRVKLIGMQGQEGHAPITNMSFIYNGGLIGSLKTKELPESLAKSEIPNIFERVTNAEIRVDRLDNKITLEVSDIKQEITRVETEATAKITANTESISLEKSERETQYGTLENVVSEQGSTLTMLNDQINTTIETRLTDAEGTLETINETISTVEGTQQTFTDRIANLEGDMVEQQTFFRTEIGGLIIGGTDWETTMNADGEKISFQSQTGNVQAHFGANGMYTNRWELDFHIIEKFEEGSTKGTIHKNRRSGS